MKVFFSQEKILGEVSDEISQKWWHFQSIVGKFHFNCKFCIAIANFHGEYVKSNFRILV
jgi:hypothetical protein